MPPHAPAPHRDPDSDPGAETSSGSDYDYVAASTGYGFDYGSEVEAGHGGDGGREAEEEAGRQVGGQWDEGYEPGLEEAPLLRPPRADGAGVGYLTPTPMARASRGVHTASIAATLAAVTQHAAYDGEWVAGRGYAGERSEGEDASGGAREDEEDVEEEEEDVIGGHAHHVPHMRRRLYGRQRARITYGRDYSDDDAGTRDGESADDEASPEPDARGVNTQRSIPDTSLYGGRVVSTMVAHLFMQRYTQPLSAVVGGAEPPNTECPICLEPPSETHECVQIRGVPGCTHLIGRVCLRQWFISQPDDGKNCPFCRTQWLSQQGIWEIEYELAAELVPGPRRE